MNREHQYTVSIKWTGNKGEGTVGYRKYSRDHELIVDGKAIVPLSSDPTFRGDSSRLNPEELLLSSLSSCHMLWYLHLCSENGVVVKEYIDHAEAIMEEGIDASGAFSKVILHPEIRIVNRDNLNIADQLHHEAHNLCFIANSVNFEVLVQPSISVR